MEESGSNQMMEYQTLCAEYERVAKEELGKYI
jgi:hypothetical protein